MKYLSKFLLGAIFGLALLTSCNKKEGCTDKGAENYDPSAERENGTCILQRVKFVGLYQINESFTLNGVPQPTLSYTSVIRSTNDNLTDVNIEELHGEFKVRARINGNQITLVNPANGYNGAFFNGSGTLVGNVLNLPYVITNFGVIPMETSNCVANFSK